MPYYIERTVDFRSKLISCDGLDLNDCVIGSFDTPDAAYDMMIKLGKQMFQHFGLGRDPQIVSAKYISYTPDENMYIRHLEFATIDGCYNSIVYRIFESDLRMPTSGRDTVHFDMGAVQ